MAWRLHEFKCPGCDKHFEDLVQVSAEGEYEMPFCLDCGLDYVRVFTPTATQFSATFFSHDRPRRVEIGYTDADGKEHRKNVTHKINLNDAPGQFTTKD